MIATYSGDANYNTVAGACNDAGEHVVVVQGDADDRDARSRRRRVTLGQSFTDTATVTAPAGGAAPTGTVTFAVYGPGDTTCTGAPVFTSTERRVNARGRRRRRRASFTPTAPGTYRVIATYSGDANYNAAGVGACNDAGERSSSTRRRRRSRRRSPRRRRTLGQSFHGHGDA